MFGVARLNTLAKAAAVASRSALTVNALGNAKISTAQSKFGSASGLFDGSGDLLTIPSLPAFGTGDFTVECWVNPTTVATIYDGIFTLRSSNSWNANTSGTEVGFPGIVLSTGVLHYASTNVAYSSNITAGSWQHIAVSRSGSSLKVFINGSQVASVTNSSNFLMDGGAVPAIGIFDRYVSTGGRLYFNGYIDEYRISNIARYTTTFTPSAAAFTNDANTLLLLHMEGTNNATTFTDSTT